MKLCSLASGSRGNALVVDLGGVRVLVDCGISHKQLVMRGLRRDIYPSSIDATLLSHGHGDHIRGARLWLGSNRGPIYGTRPTLVAADIDGRVGAERIHTRQCIPISETVEVQALPTIHNSIEPVTFALTDHDTGEKLVMIFETGRASDTMFRELETATVLAVEANHDPEMLADNEEIPDFLKQRIRATHLSNGAAAAVIRQIPVRCKLVMLLHLSQENNAPGLACNIVRRALDQIGRQDVRLVIAEQDEPSEVLEVT